jgi:hypothetical protein
MDIYLNLIIIENNNGLFQLYQRGTYLNPDEGMAISSRIGMMNSGEFECKRAAFKSIDGKLESRSLDKKNYIKMLFDNLKHNKYATLKCLKLLSENIFSKQSFIFALDTTNYLAEDKAIAQVFDDDLMLFATLINSDDREAYYAGRIANSTAIMSNLESVKKYLSQAAISGDGNNLNYAFKVLVHAKEYFTYPQFLGAFAEISRLDKFNTKAVDKILIDHNFKLKAEVPEIFSRSSESLRNNLILLIMLFKKIARNGIAAMTLDSFTVLPEVSIVEETNLRLLELKCDEYAKEVATAKEATIVAEIDKEADGAVKAQDQITKAREKYQEAFDKYQETNKKYQIEAGRLEKKRQEREIWQREISALSGKEISELQQILKQSWQENGRVLATLSEVILKPMLANLKASYINEEFSILDNSAFSLQLRNKIHDLASFAKVSDFEKLD